jgi:hypothetical protein
VTSSNASDTVTSAEDSAVLGLANALLPGGQGFPAAGSTGMGDLLLARLRGADPAPPGKIAAALGARGYLPDQETGWRDAAARLEAVEPKLFDELRKYAYLTYYEQPSVIDAIRSLGFRYNDSPLPDGYPDEPFDPDRDAPRHGRGRWIRTEDVKRVDLSRLGLEGTR